MDDERPGRLQLDSTLYALREGGPGVTVKVKRTIGTEGEVSVLLSSQDGTATAGGDFSMLPQTLTFAAGVDEMTATLTALPDGVVEGNEAFTVSLSDPTGHATLGPTSVASVFITDVDDQASIITGLASVIDNRAGAPAGRIRAAVSLDDGSVLIGGDFSAGNGRYGGLARLKPDGTLDTDFPASGVDGIIHALARQADGRIVAAGSFSFINGALRARVARLLPDGAVDPDFVPPTFGPNQPVSAVGVQSDGQVIVAGNFTTIGGSPRIGIARASTSPACGPTARSTPISNLPSRRASITW